MKDNLAIATFGNGCFWCTEAIFQQLKGVETVVSGYTGGQVKNPVRSLTGFFWAKNEILEKIDNCNKISIGVILCHLKVFI